MRPENYCVVVFCLWDFSFYNRVDSKKLEQWNKHSLWSTQSGLRATVIHARPHNPSSLSQNIFLVLDQGTSWDEDLPPVPRNPEHNLQISDYIHINFFSKTKVETVSKTNKLLSDSTNCGQYKTHGTQFESIPFPLESAPMRPFSRQIVKILKWRLRHHGWRHRISGYCYRFQLT